MTWFEPHDDALGVLGMCAPETLLHKQDDSTLLVPVWNYQGMAVHMEAGTLLGEILSLEHDHKVLMLDKALHMPSLAKDENGSATSSNAPVQAVFNIPDRINQIVDALPLLVTKLSSDQAFQSKALIAEFPDVFALSDAELDCTDLIKHSINTGDHAPIKQQPYHTPSVLSLVLF